MSDIYEPWVPEVGQRVRCRPSPECRVETSYETGIDGGMAVAFLGRAGHDPAEDGATGYVHTVAPRDDIPTDPAFDAHRFLVVYDEAVTPSVVTEPQWCQYFAAIELEAIE